MPRDLVAGEDQVVRGVVAVDDHLGVGERLELPGEVEAQERYGRVVEPSQHARGADERGLASYGL